MNSGELVMRRFPNFDFSAQKIDNFRNVRNFVLRHLFFTMNLELHNRFSTTKRVLSTGAYSSEYPHLIYGRKRDSPMTMP
ncbi:MAG: hypothetical protein QXU18_07170 [Thermoplasmatales archaeon]